jgi:transcriptional regulator with GAF, ATPase, and Fis domain/serine/threonine protein kinase/Tfp pilus assembly protein PilF
MKKKIINKRYEVLEKLGEGGMGSVLLVLDKLAEENRALKLLSTGSLSSGDIEVLTHEFKSLTELRHPNIARVYEFGYEEGEGVPFFTSEHVPGRDLFAATRGMAPEEIYPLMAQILRALDYLHSRGYIHNDLKPSNILVIPPDKGRAKKGEATVKLIDFGLLRDVSDVRSSAVAGTIHYLAPEKILRGQSDPRSDLYSLGISLYQIFTGDLPFAGGSTISLIRDQVELPPAPPRTKNPAIPEPLEAILLRLLAKEPENRYISAGEVIREMNQKLKRNFSLEVRGKKERELFAGKFVGRKKEITLLKQALDDVTSPRGGVRICPVEGEEGMGKSRLLRELSYLFQISKVRYATGTPEETETEYGPFASIVRELFLTLPETSSALELHGPKIARLAPAEAASRGIHALPPLEPSAEPMRLLDGLCGFFAEISREQPLAIILEDLHRADPFTIKAFGFLARNLPRAERSDRTPRLLLCPSFSREEIQEKELRAILEGLTGRRGVRWIRLSGLEEEECRNFIASIFGRIELSPGFIERIFESTKGNPHFIAEALKSMKEKGLLFLEKDAWKACPAGLESLDIPKNLEEMMERRVEALTPSHRKLLELMAVIGRPAPLKLIETLRESGDGELWRDLRDLKSNGFLRELRGETGEALFNLSHARLQRILYRGLPNPEKATIHGRIASYLEQQSPGGEGTLSVEIARHAIRAGDATKVPMALEATHRFKALGRWEDARKLCERMLAIKDISEADQAVVSAELGQLHSSRGESKAAFEHLNRAKKIFKKLGDEKGLGDVYLSMGWSHYFRGDWEDSFECTRKAYGIFSPLKDEKEKKGLWAAMNLEGLLLYQMGKPQEAIHCHKEAYELAKQAEMQDPQASSANNLGMVLKAQGNYKEGAKYYRTCIRLHKEAGGELRLFAPYINLGNVLLQLGQRDKARGYYRKSLKIARKLGNRFVAGINHINLGTVCFQAMDMTKALKHGQRAVDLLSEIAERSRRLSAMNNLSWLLIQAGDLKKARSLLERALELNETPRDKAQYAATRHNLGKVLFETGETEEGIRNIEEGIAVYRELNYLPDVTACLNSLSLCASRLGRFGQALEAISSEDLASGARVSQAFALERPYCQGKVHLSLLRLEAAERYLRRALGRARSRSHLPFEVLCLTGIGRLERIRGNLPGAREYLEAARAILTEKGPGLLRLNFFLEEAELQVSRGRPDRAREILDAARASNIPEYSPETASGLDLLEAKILLLDPGCPVEEPRQKLESVLELSRSLKNSVLEAETELFLAIAHDLDGKRREARKHRARRDAILEEIAARLPGDLETSYLGEMRETGHRASSRIPAARSAKVHRGRVEGIPAGPESGDLQQILAVVKALNSERDLSKLLGMIMDAALEITGAERGFLLIEEDDQEQFYMARNFHRESIPENAYKISHSIATEAIKKGRAVVAHDAIEEEEFKEFRSVRELRLRSVLSLPFRVKGKILGAFYLDSASRGDLFRESDLRLLEAFSDQAAVAFENARLFDENRESLDRIARLNERLKDRLETQTVELSHIREQLRIREAELRFRYSYENIVGRSVQMVKLFRLLDKVIPSEVPVVILGESGSGKELIAKAIHYNGPRGACPFLSLNCGAVSESLLESELFGHVKGSFTGAHKDKKGLFELASGGTLFLDEVAEMSPSMQRSLLRVLEEGEVRRVGGKDEISVDVRVISATNKDLAELVRNGLFREDLYFRLNVFRIDLPPLRERKEDIPPLVEHFLAEIAEREEAKPRKLTKSALRALMSYEWPGNVRELENVVEQAWLLDRDGRISKEDIPPLRAPGERELTLEIKTDGMTLADVERSYILAVLRKNAGHRAKTAKELRISTNTLWRKLKEYGLQQ